MQLNVTTDYALRVVLHIMAKEDIATRSEICDTMGIPPNSVPAITSVLKKAGIIGEVRGPHGGFQLEKNKNEITMQDVIDAFEKTTKINRCLENDAYCSRQAAEFCEVRKYYEKMQDHFERCMQKKLIDFLD